MNIKDEFAQDCSCGDLEKVKYLLTSPELKEHADIHAKDDWLFKIEGINSTIQWVRDWHQANLESARLKKMVAAEGVSKKVSRI